MEQKVELPSAYSTETKPIKAFGYACFPKDVKVDVSKELMSAFINASLTYASVEVVDSFVEPNNRKGFINRWEWNAMMKRCREEGVKLIVIPAIKMLSYYLVDALDRAKKVKEEFDIDIYLNEYRILQIKEKYGELRWYDKGAPREVHDIVEKYSLMSAQLCINCGKPATVITDGWICPYCDDCAPKSGGTKDGKVL